MTGVIVWTLTRSAAPAVSRFPIVLGADESFTFTNRQLLALSPDGHRFAYVANQRLYFRALDQLATTALTPSEIGVASPFFSPDGQWVGFTSGGQLKKIAIGGGAPIALCAADLLFGASWGTDDTIFFGQG